MNVLETIEQTRQALDGVADDKKLPLVNSLMTLTRKLLGDVMAFRDIPDSFQTEIYPGLVSQLHAAEKRTETAANDIMSAAERIMGALGKIDGAGKTDVQKGVNSLFEACNFQDLVAQHLNEIKILMTRLEADMTDLRNCMNDIDADHHTPVNGIRKKQALRSDAHLLNGPATNV